jgi:hypothetical protein
VVPLSRSIFRELLFDDFRLATSRVGVQLRLLEIRDLASRSMPESENAFSLHFLATPSAPLEQGTYALVHPRRGRFDLFLVPMGGGELPAYEAVINNLQIPVGPTRGRTARPRA